MQPHMQVNLEAAGFEGPLDLLLHLIKKLEIDIYDIPMSEITEQYLLYIHSMQVLELDIASEYLVMAATLLAIKSQMLLPKYEEDLDDEILDEDYSSDPREELVAKLLEYRKYKEASLDLKEKEKERALMFTKAPSDLSDYASTIQVTQLDGKVTIYDMLGAFHKLLRRKRLQAPLKTKIKKTEISLEVRMDEILDKLRQSRNWTPFEQLFPYPVKEHIVVTFLALLELMKQNLIAVSQKGNFEELLVIAN